MRLQVKKSVLRIISFLLTLFISIKYFVSKAFLCISITDRLNVCRSLKLSNFSICSRYQTHNYQVQNAVSQGQVGIDWCYQSIIDSSISLCLTTFFINYNQFLMRFTLLISHQVHHFFLSYIFKDLPDYSLFVQEIFSNFLVWMLIFFGFFGLSHQLAFIIDLIHILTLPTKIIYQILSKIYNILMILMGKIVQIIKKDNDKWITCQYPCYLLTKNAKTIAIGLLIMTTQLTIFITFYYAWLSCIIFLLTVLQNSLQNLYRIVLRMGKLFCILKTKDIQFKSSQYSDCFYLPLIPIFEVEILVKIVKGICMMNQFDKNTINNYNSSSVYFSTTKIYNCLIKFSNTLMQN